MKNAYENGAPGPFKRAPIFMMGDRGITRSI